MTPETAAALMAPFAGNEVGKLPRVTCRKCSDPRKFGDCDQHQKAKCNTCGSWISTQHIHIDYVGHADVTARLLRVDPSWTWEPAAVDGVGRPLFDLDADSNPVGLWIRLTVGGVTRLGYGSVPGNQSDAVKVLIGDALRNAALRFGVAWDLWAKGDRSDPTAENATASAGTPQRRSGRQAQPPAQRQGPPQNGNNGQRASQAPSSEAEQAREALRSAAAREKWDGKRMAEVFAQQHGVSLKETENADHVRAFMAALTADAEHVLGQREGAAT